MKRKLKSILVALTLALGLCAAENLGNKSFEKGMAYVGITYAMSEVGYSNEKTAAVGVIGVFHSAAYGGLYGAAFGGPAGFAAGVVLGL